MINNLLGIHHVTAITSSSQKIYDFFTYIMGMRLVKKTVNQDDIDTYHLFFADDKGSAGTDITFFDFKGIGKKVVGDNEISRTSFRVTSDEALTYWLKRFTKFAIKHSEIKTMFGKKMIEFSDFDDQLYALISDENNVGVKSGTPWIKGPVPNEYAITGLGPIFLRASDSLFMEQVLVNTLGFKKVLTENEFTLFEVGEGGNGASVIVEKTKGNNRSIQGYGAIHHVAFRVENEDELNKIIKEMNEKRFPNSGFVDRFYFKSLYTRLYPSMLFEFATDGPGFIDDEEPYETLGELLALPPKFRDKRSYVESVVKPFDTTRSNKVFSKEYL